MDLISGTAVTSLPLIVRRRSSNTGDLKVYPYFMSDCLASLMRKYLLPIVFACGGPNLLSYACASDISTKIFSILTQIVKPNQSPFYLFLNLC
jgi:hypothetical protein